MHIKSTNDRLLSDLCPDCRKRLLAETEGMTTSAEVLCLLTGNRVRAEIFDGLLVCAETVARVVRVCGPSTLQ